MSQRSQMAMTDDEVAAFIEGGRRAHVATIDPDGMPHVVPLSYVVIDGRVTLWTDPASRKVHNLRRDPRVTCLIEEGSHFAEFRAVQMKGRAEVADDPDEVLSAGLALFARARGGNLTDEVKAAVQELVPQRVAVTIVPEQVVSWDHRKIPGLRPGQAGK